MHSCISRIFFYYQPVPAIIKKWKSEKKQLQGLYDKASKIQGLRPVTGDAEPISKRMPRIQVGKTRNKTDVWKDIATGNLIDEKFFQVPRTQKSLSQSKIWKHRATFCWGDGRLEKVWARGASAVREKKESVWLLHEIMIAMRYFIRMLRYFL